MPGDDDVDEEGGSGLLLPPDDRLWRHPSELSAAAPAARRPDNRMWAVALLAGAVGALLATGVGIATGRLHTRTVEVTAVEHELMSPTATLASTGTASVLAAGAAEVGASCAQLTANGDGGERTSSGVVFRSDGMVITPAHTVLGASSLSGEVPGHRRVSAHVVATDPATDLAVVKLDGSGYEPAPLGTALQVKAGDPIVALEPPDAHVNRGSVDAFGATLDSEGGRLTGLLRIATSKTLSSIGGPVIDDHGAVIAITTAFGSAGQAVEFATPVDVFRQVATQLLREGKVTPVWLGVEGHDLPADKATGLGVAGGAVLDKVYSPSPAADAGLRSGDTVVAVDGRVVGSMAAFVLAMHALAPGSRISLAVARDGSARTMTAVLEPRPDWVT